jgi:multiple sugar transport system ATP-binding protein
MELDVKPLRIDSMLLPAALEVHGLSKAFGAKTALNDIGFAVPEGSLTVLLGSAGAGKTTVLRVVAGLDRPDAGQVTMRGRDVTGLEPKDRDIAMIFDNLALYPDRTGFANIASPLLIRRMSKAEIEQRVAQVAATLRIAHVLNRLPKTMSGGERQRVALGRALIRKPGLFLLDEPLSSLDAMLRIELRAELKRLQREIGATFLFATPDFAEAMAVADTVVMLRDGRIVQVAAAQSLYEEPVDREVARFVGSPEINLLKAVFEPAIKGTIRAGGASIVGMSRLQNVLPKAGGPFEIGIRPEQVRLLLPEEAPIQARVFDIEPLGLKSMVTVRNEDAEIRLIVDTGIAGKYSVGQAVGVELVDSGLLAFDAVTGKRFV